MGPQSRSEVGIWVSSLQKWCIKKPLRIEEFAKADREKTQGLQCLKVGKRRKSSKIDLGGIFTSGFGNIKVLVNGMVGTKV